MEIEKKPTGEEVNGMEFGAIGSLTDLLWTIQNEVLDYRAINLEQLVFMTRNDGQAKGILNSIKNPIKMARPIIEPPKEGDAEEETNFIRKNLLGVVAEGGMEIPIRRVAATMAMAVRDGYKIFEKVWQLKDGKIWLKKLAYRSSLTTNFVYDGHGNVNGALQKTLVDGEQKDIPYSKEKIVYYMYNSEENPYCGESDFIPVFYHYDKKHKLYAIAHLAYQLNAVPIRVGTHPKFLKGEELKNFRDSLASLGTRVSMTIPEGCKVDFQTAERRLTEFLYLIRHHDSMMSRAFLTQFMNLGQEGSGGSFALSSDQSNLFLMAIMGLLEDIAEVFNSQVIPQLIDWNFGTKKYPRVKFSPFSDAMRSSIMKTFTSMLTARFPGITTEFALELEEAMAGELGLQINYEDVKKRQASERQELLKAEVMAASEEEEETSQENEGAGRPVGSETKVPKVGEEE